MIPAEEMVIKVRAAVAARRSDETLIIARSDALQVTGLDDAIARCNAYARGRRRPRLRRRAARPSRSTRRSPSACAGAVRREHVGDRAVARRSRPTSSRRWATSSSSSRARRPGSSRRPTSELCQAVVRDRTTASLADRFTSFDDVNALLGLAEWQVAVSARRTSTTRAASAAARARASVRRSSSSTSSRASRIRSRRCAATPTRRSRRRAQLLDAARAASVPVLFTTVCYAEDDLERAAKFIAKAPALATLRPGLAAGSRSTRGSAAATTSRCS